MAAIRIELIPPEISLRGEIVTVQLGDSEEHLKVYRRHICASSDFFRVALDERREWEEATRLHVNLPGVPFHIFHLYLQWLYMRQLRFDTLKTSNEDVSQQYDNLIQLWILGDLIQDVDCRDEVMDAIWRFNAFFGKDKVIRPPVPSLVRIFEETAHDSKIQKFMIDLFIAYGTENWIGQQDGASQPLLEEDYGAKFLVQLGRALLKNRYRADSKIFGANAANCAYHDHDRYGKTCYRRRRTYRNVVD
jgi:hypothetical protein